MRREWVDTVMDVFEIRRVRGISYIEETLLLLEPGEVFTVKELETRTQILKRHIYRMIEKYHQFFEKTSSHVFPEGYVEYSVKRKRRYREENGLPIKGNLSARYLFIEDTAPLIDYIIDNTIEKTRRLRELNQTPTIPPQEKELEIVHC